MCSGIRGRLLSAGVLLALLFFVPQPTATEPPPLTTETVDYSGGENGTIYLSSMYGRVVRFSVVIGGEAREEFLPPGQKMSIVSFTYGQPEATEWIDLDVGTNGKVTVTRHTPAAALSSQKAAISPLISLGTMAAFFFLLAKFGGHLLHLQHLSEFFSTLLGILARTAESSLGPDRTVRILGMLLTFGAFVLLLLDLLVHKLLDKFWIWLIVAFIIGTISGGFGALPSIGTWLSDFRLRSRQRRGSRLFGLSCSMPVLA